MLSIHADRALYKWAIPPDGLCIYNLFRSRDVQGHICGRRSTELELLMVPVKMCHEGKEFWFEFESQEFVIQTPSANFVTS